MAGIASNRTRGRDNNKGQETAETEFKRTGGECLLHKNVGQSGTGVLGLQYP